MENWIQKVCGALTKHKIRVQRAESMEIEPTEYHHTCSICRYRFWNYTESKRKTYKT